MSVDGKVNGDERLAPVARVVIEMRGNQVGVNTNCPPQVAINMMKDGIVALAQAMVREQDKQLVKPVPSGTILPMPPRLP